MPHEKSDHAARWGSDLAAQFAHSGLRTIVIGDAKQLGREKPEYSIPDILTHRVHPRDALVGLDTNLAWIASGSAEALFPFLSSAQVEILLQEIMQHAEAVIIIAPSRDNALLQRLAHPVAGVCVTVEADKRSGRAFASQMKDLEKPVHMAVIAS